MTLPVGEWWHRDKNWERGRDSSQRCSGRWRDIRLKQHKESVCVSLCGCARRENATLSEQRGRRMSYEAHRNKSTRRGMRKARDEERWNKEEREKNQGDTVIERWTYCICIKSSSLLKVLQCITKYYTQAVGYYLKVRSLPTREATVSESYANISPNLMSVKWGMRVRIMQLMRVWGWYVLVMSDCPRGGCQMPRPLQGPGIAASLSTVTLLTFILYLITSYAKDNLCLWVGKQWREEKKREDTLRDIALMITANIFARPLRSRP